MAKILNIRERVHQPFRDNLIRTGGLSAGGLAATTQLFTKQNQDEGYTNLQGSGGTLPNDSSMIILAIRILLWFRAPIQRSLNAGHTLVNGDWGTVIFGDGLDWPDAASEPAQGTAPGNLHDVYRLHHQCAEGLFWTLGAGDKDSLKSMPSMYFPYGGGLDGDVGGNTELIHFNNGVPSHTSILRIARAITITPRQLIKVMVTGQALPSGGNQTIFGTNTAQGRSMLDPISNLNAVDAIAKVVGITLDGLVSRDVQ